MNNLKSCQFILSIFLFTSIQAILPTSSKATVTVKDKVDSITELSDNNSSKDSGYLITQNNRIGCVKNGQYSQFTLSPYYNLVSTVQGVIQSNLTESQCQNAVKELRQIQVSGVSCIKNGQYSQFTLSPYYNLVSPNGVIQTNLTESDCRNAVGSF